MIGKPFQVPLLRKTEEAEDSDRVLEPRAKKRRMNSGKGDCTNTPRLVFKTPGISSLPRKPLLAVKNPVVALKPLDGGLEGYYNVLWFVHLHDGHTGL